MIYTMQKHKEKKWLFGDQAAAEDKAAKK